MVDLRDDAFPAPDRATLSADGERRKAALRAQLVARVSGRRRRRRMAEVLVTVAAAVLLTFAWPRAEPRRQGVATPGGGFDPVSCRIVSTDPDVMSRYRVRDLRPVERVDDEVLLAMLRTQGAAVGLVRVASRVELLGFTPDPWRAIGP